MAAVQHQKANAQPPFLLLHCSHADWVIRTWVTRSSASVYARRRLPQLDHPTLIAGCLRGASQ